MMHAWEDVRLLHSILNILTSSKAIFLKGNRIQSFYELAYMGGKAALWADLLQGKNLQFQKSHLDQQWTHSSPLTSDIL